MSVYIYLESKYASIDSQTVKDPIANASLKRPAQRAQVHVRPGAQGSQNHHGQCTRVQGRPRPPRDCHASDHRTPGNHCATTSTMETTTNRPTGDCQATTGRPPKDPPDTTARSDQRIGITMNRASAGTREREHLMRPGRNLGTPLRKGSHARSRACARLVGAKANVRRHEPHCLSVPHCWGINYVY